MRWLKWWWSLTVVEVTMLLTGMVEEKMYPVLRDHRLCGGSKWWYRDMENNWFSNHFSHLGNRCEFWLYSSVVKLPKWIQVMLETWIMRNCALFLETQCLSATCLAVQMYRKGKELHTYKYNTNSSACFRHVFTPAIMMSESLTCL